MAYHSYLSNAIAIHPPISGEELATSPFVCLDPFREADRLAWLHLVNGEAVAIRPSEADELDAETLARDIQYILDRHGLGRSFAGWILVFGEDSPDVWRVEVQDGKAVEVRPTLVWPDGTEQEAEPEVGHRFVDEALAVFGPEASR